MHSAPSLRRCNGCCSQYMCLHTRHGSAAESSVLALQADKSVLTAQLNLHTRDLRILDPMLTQMNPCAILCRDRALLINLEHVKCIVTMEYVLVLNVENRAVLSFLDELQKKLKQQVSAGTPFCPLVWLMSYIMCNRVMCTWSGHIRYVSHASRTL